MNSVSSPIMLRHVPHDFIANHPHSAELKSPTKFPRYASRSVAVEQKSSTRLNSWITVLIDLKSRWKPNFIRHSHKVAKCLHFNANDDCNWYFSPQIINSRHISLWWPRLCFFILILKEVEKIIRNLIRFFDSLARKVWFEWSPKKTWRKE